MDNYLSQGLVEAWRLIIALDPDVAGAVRVSMVTSLSATALAACVCVPAGFFLGLYAFPGKAAVSAVLHTLTGIPTVVVGLLGYLLLTAHGPLGGLNLLYSPGGMIFGLFLLLIPLITALSMSATQSIHAGVHETALTLGATPIQAAAMVVREGRFAYVTALATGFGRAIGEVGVAMMLGGNIRGYTRTMTTTLALETDKGRFALALALGLILLVAALCVNISLHFLKSRSERA